MRNRVLPPIFLGLVLALHPLLSQETPFVSAPARQALLDELSGEMAKDQVIMISRYDRIQASPGWHEAALYIKGELERSGFTGIQLEAFDSDGEKQYWTWTPPLGWRAQSAELWLVEPMKKKLADFEEVPTSLVKGSRSAEVTAEVIAIDGGTRPEDYEGKEVKGKIILATGYTGNVHREGVIKRGAVGVVTYLGRRDRMEYPDLVPYTGLWLRKSEVERATFGFTISRRQAEELLDLLGRGQKVVLHARVEAEVFPSQVEMLSATIPGTSLPQEEVLLLAHLDHYQPGANDNASGSAGVLEVARTFKQLIAEEKLPPPRRTLRFLWVTEWNGTIPWLKAHPELWQRTLAAVNFDMIGGDQVTTRSYFYLTRTPHSRPSFLDDLLAHLLEVTRKTEITSPRGSSHPWDARAVDYRGGSDHWMLNDATIGIPASMFGHPDPYHHTIQDVPDHIDPLEMKRVMALGALTLWALANAGDAEASRLADLVAAGALSRLVEVARDGLQSLAETGNTEDLVTAYREATNPLHFAGERERAAIQSVERFAQQGETGAWITGWLAELETLQARLAKRLEQGYRDTAKARGWPAPRPVPTVEERAASRLVPRRDFQAPLNGDYLVEAVGAEAVRALKIQGEVGWEITNFMDGRRSLLDIRNAVSAEFGPQSLEEVIRYVRLLERASLVILRSPR